MREQLAYLGEAPLPEVRQRMAQAVDDRSRQRLSALRYRLLASDSLVLRWPNGIDRLAVRDSPSRRQAADELTTRAKSSDKAPSVESFGDADAMVREISLRAIEHVGGSLASETLVKMLADPEPNVRAAILKQLAEKPMARLVGPVSEYVEKEKDPDLIMYAIRFLATSGTSAAHEAIVKLLEHPSWQVRAEARKRLAKIRTPPRTLPSCWTIRNRSSWPRCWRCWATTTWRQPCADSALPTTTRSGAKRIKPCSVEQQAPAPRRREIPARIRQARRPRGVRCRHSGPGGSGAGRLPGGNFAGNWR